MSQGQSGKLMESLFGVHGEMIRRSRLLRLGAALGLLLLAPSTTLEVGVSLPNLFPFPDPAGFSASYSATGFQS
jgi:hypothetical protein